MAKPPSLDGLQIDILSRLTDILKAIWPSLVLGLFFVICAFAAVYVGRRLLRKLQFGDDSRRRILEAWAEVEEHVEDGDETHLRMAIIKADAVLDMALMAKGFPGRTLNDRLNFAIHKYRRLKEVRWAHGVRNRLAHDPLHGLSRREGTGAIGSFRAALRELGAL